jgi:hypothetical protein
MNVLDSTVDQYASAVRPTLLYSSGMLKEIRLGVTLNEVKGLVYLKTEILRFPQNDNQSTETLDELH